MYVNVRIGPDAVLMNPLDQRLDSVRWLTPRNHMIITPCRFIKWAIGFQRIYMTNCKGQSGGNEHSLFCFPTTRTLSTCTWQRQFSPFKRVTFAVPVVQKMPSWPSGMDRTWRRVPASPGCPVRQQTTRAHAWQPLPRLSPWKQSRTSWEHRYLLRWGGLEEWERCSTCSTLTSSELGHSAALVSSCWELHSGGIYTFA